MEPKAKSTKKAPGDAPDISLANLPLAMAGLMQNGVERIAEMQKSALDFAAKQNAEAIDVCKKAVRLPETSPLAGAFDMAMQAFDSLVSVQKSMLDMMTEQSNSMLEYAQERGTAMPSLEGLNDLVAESVDRATAAQKSVLSFAEQQSKAVTESLKKQAGVPGTRVAEIADSVQRGVDAILESQKEMVDLAAKPLKSYATQK